MMLIELNPTATGLIGIARLRPLSRLRLKCQQTCGLLCLPAPHYSEFRQSICGGRTYFGYRVSGSGLWWGGRHVLILLLLLLLSSKIHRPVAPEDMLTKGKLEVFNPRTETLVRALSVNRGASALGGAVAHDCEHLRRWHAVQGKQRSHFSFERRQGIQLRGWRQGGRRFFWYPCITVSSSS